MKFIKLSKSEKFEYMMLSRLIQDAKYFIEHPDLKYLWARTLDEHIKQMLEQYTKLDPKPEWTSEDEIYELADKMKKSYTNHWNEVHPDNKIEAAVQQPNKPKPTTMLPDNMEWAWDPDAADWVAVLKDNANTTPPLYDPNNQNVVNQTTNYMGAIKSASEKIHKLNFEAQNAAECAKQLLQNFELYNYFRSEVSLGDMIETKNGKRFILQDIMDFANNFEKQSSCLSKFLDGPQYSKEIKIESGLIKEGLVKYAGFDFNRGTKYTITTKGLEVLRKASEAEHNEALNEREKLAYMFGFNTDKETTLDTTGKVIKSDELSKCEWCGEEFDESELEDTELGKVCYRCKKGIESKEGSMNNKNISEAKQYLEKYLLENPELFKYQYGKDNVEEVLKELIEENPNWYKKFSSKKWTICEADGSELGEVEADSELDAKVKFGIEHPEYAESLSISAKEIEAKYEETTESHEPYPNPSETPNDHITLENHDGWVNTAEQKVTPEFAKLHSILGEYKKNEHILSITQDGKDLLVSCSPIASYEMKQKIEQLGYECEETDESETGDVYDLPSYTLRIKMK